MTTKVYKATRSDTYDRLYPFEDFSDTDRARMLKIESRQHKCTSCGQPTYFPDMCASCLARSIFKKKGN